MNFLSVQEPTLLVFDGLLFWVFDPLYFGGCNFLISNPFWMIVSVSDALRRGSSLVWTPETMEPSPSIQPALSA